jgi:hypothetical protein
VDLLVIGNAGLRTLAPVLRSAGQVLGREINPVTMTAAEFKRGRTKNPLLVDILGKPKLFVKGRPDELGRLGLVAELREAVLARISEKHPKLSPWEK